MIINVLLVKMTIIYQKIKILAVKYVNYLNKEVILIIIQNNAQDAQTIVNFALVIMKMIALLSKVKLSI